MLVHCMAERGHPGIGLPLVVGIIIGFIMYYYGHIIMGIIIMGIISCDAHNNTW